MHPVEIRPDIFWIGINDRSTELFEGLWPILHQGVSYNAYLIKDEKNALIDLSKETFTDMPSRSPSILSRASTSRRSCSSLTTARWRLPAGGSPLRRRS